MKGKIKYIIAIFSIIILLIVSIFIIFKCISNKISVEINSNYNLYDLLGEKDISNINIISSNLDISKIGDYDIELKINYITGKEKTKKLVISVIDTTKPCFSNCEDIIIIKDEEFKALDGITAIDNGDGNITDKITILSNNVDISKTGDYIVTYSVVDSNGNQEILNRKIKVVDKKFEEIHLAIEYIKTNLRNPESFVLKEVNYDYYPEYIANYNVVIIKYSAQNGFGGTTTETRYLNVYLEDKKVETNPVGNIIGINGEKINISDINKQLGTNY